MGELVLAVHDQDAAGLVPFSKSSLQEKSSHSKLVEPLAIRSTPASDDSCTVLLATDAFGALRWLRVHPGYSTRRSWYQ